MIYRWLITLALALALAGCVSDGHGGYGTRWMAEQWARSDIDGSAACTDVLSFYARDIHRFGMLCHFSDRDEKCVCSIHDEPLILKPIGYAVPVFTFPPIQGVPLSPGVRWTPKVEARHAEVRSAHDDVRQLRDMLLREGL